MKKFTSDEIINFFGLEPLPEEGGMIRSLFHSDLSYDDGIEAYNSILYLLRDGAFSHLHRLPYDELYHFYMGDPLEILELRQDGTSRVIILGDDYEKGQVPQAVVHRNSWHGSRVFRDGEYSFVGTSMAPGYTEEGYEHCYDNEALIERFPEWEEMIRELTGQVKH